MSIDLDIALDRSATGLLSHQIGRRLTDLISSGALPPGFRMPSTRSLATQLNVSRMAVVDAYAWLSDNGYIHARERSRAVVCKLGLIKEHRPEGNVAQIRPASRDEQAGLIDFRPGIPDLASFPRAKWGAALSRASRRLLASELDYGDPFGRMRLRTAIAHYLTRARGLSPRPENIVITSGTGQALDILVRAIPGLQEIVVESPGPDALERLPGAYGIRLNRIPVDADGLQTDLLPRGPAPRLAHVIPSHQLPTGCVMSMTRRLALIAWAQATGAYVFEDDYDSEFTYDGRPALPLAKLDRGGRIIYAGTFSKTLTPGLRLGFMIIPDALADRVAALKWWADHGGAVLEQEALADWIERGAFERHVYRMRKTYRQRFTVLRSVLEGRLGKRVRLAGAPVGMHLAAYVRSPHAASEIEEEARLRGVGVRALPTNGAAGCGFVFGFGNLEEAEIRAGANAFCDVVLSN